MSSIPKVIEFTMLTLQDQFSLSEEIKVDGIELLGNIARVYKGEVASYMISHRVMDYLHENKTSTNEELRRTVFYSMYQIQMLV